MAKEEDISFLLSNNDTLQEIKRAIIENYKISSFDNNQLCKCLMLLMLFIATQGSLDSAWSSLGAGCPRFTAFLLNLQLTTFPVLGHKADKGLYI